MSKQNNSKDPRARGRAVGQAIVELFDKMSMHAEAAVDIAVANLDNSLADPSIDIKETVEVISSVQHLLEFILCGTLPPLLSCAEIRRSTWRSL